MKAVILAAGIASRLRPLTNDCPKCLLKVGNRSLLQRSMDALKQNGIREFVVVTGYLHHQIEDFLKANYSDLKISFIHNDLYESTNNIYSLWLARPEADGEDILLLDSDLLYDPMIVRRVLDSDSENLLTLIRHDLGEEEIKVIIDKNGAITQLNKTCNPADAIGESLGIERMGRAYTKALYEELEVMMEKEGLVNVFYERAFERLFPKGHTYQVLDVTDLFSCELDTVDDFNAAKRRIPAALY
ncbi:MAG: phosphocholine cytidylyltransferase family protein [Paludibacteraceae bacterium]|nr:phosphocholine cytidylyltransferase family protein [Paludibacteraceae bacterium]